MRKKANACPNCKGQTQPDWRFCLACGEVLQVDVVQLPPDPMTLTTKQEKAYRKGKIRCWQCHEKLSQPSPGCPKCGADLLNPREINSTPEIQDPGGSLSSLPLPVIFLFILMGVAVIGGVGFLMSSSKNGGTTEDTSGFQMPAMPEISLDSIFGDDEAAASDVPSGIDVKATEGRAISVDDSGLVIVRIDGHDVDVRLAGLSDTFADDCLGDKALARVRRILPEGAVVWLYLDGTGQVFARSEVGTQSVYIWQIDPETDKVRFVNREVIAGGEAELHPTILTSQSPAQKLVAAEDRAESKERGRFAEDACS